MKKLKLNALDLGAIETLSRAQMKNILGGDDYSGYGNSNCGFQTSSGRWVEVVPQNAGDPTKDKAKEYALTTEHYYEVGPNGFQVDLGVPNGHWCCDHCPW